MATATDSGPASDSVPPQADSVDVDDVDISSGNLPVAMTETVGTVVQKGTRMKPVDVETEGVMPPPQKPVSAPEVVASSLAPVKREGGDASAEATIGGIKPGDGRVMAEEAMPVGVAASTAAAVVGGGSNGLRDGVGAVSEVDKGEGEGKDAMVSKKRALPSGWDRDCDVDIAAGTVKDGRGSSGDGEFEGEGHPRKRWEFMMVMALQGRGFVCVIKLVKTPAGNAVAS